MDANGDSTDHKKQDEHGQHPPSDSAPKIVQKDTTPPPPLTSSNEDNISGGPEMGTQSHSQSSPSKVKSPSAPAKSVTWSVELTKEASPVSQILSTDAYSSSSSPSYVSAPSPAPSSSSVKNTMHNVKDVLGRWGKKAGETTKKAEDLAGNLWQHWSIWFYSQTCGSSLENCYNYALRRTSEFGPSFADAAMGRIAQGTKVIAEGGYEKIFQHTFETTPEEQLRRSFACYLSTSAGPVMGTLYLSTAKFAFCSDNPLSYKVGDRTEWSYYKVVIPLHQLKAVNPSRSKTKSAEKYIQVVSLDNHEFWFMSFVNYESAVRCLRESLQARDAEAV
ncbi:hypothetical protein Scep_002119 [Stephania cephalantha]|uniref:GRAM domain-containing protein n=1 Tax=Stephania cephalantha TaxID=152367 RepID=A0AAP0Q4N8_9MAGN